MCFFLYHHAVANEEAVILVLFAGLETIESGFLNSCVTKGTKKSRSCFPLLFNQRSKSEQKIVSRADLA